jgi:transposase
VRARTRTRRETDTARAHLRLDDCGTARVRDWLESHGVTHVAVESTGVLWKPVFYLLEEAFTCQLVNPVHGA